MSRDISKSIKSKLSPLNCHYSENTIIMNRREQIHRVKRLDDLLRQVYDILAESKSYDDCIKLYDASHDVITQDIFYPLYD